MSSLRATITISLVLTAWALIAGCKSECEFDTDCPGTEVCGAGGCVEPESLDMAIAGRCDGPSDCAIGEQCRAGRCEPIGEDPHAPVCEVTLSDECGDDLCLPTGEVKDCEEPPCELILGCREPTGSARPARACLADSDCSTGWCRDFVCASVCLGDGSCPPGFACVKTTERPPWGEESGRLRLCVPDDPDAVQCDAPSMCPGELTCIFRYPEDPGTRCGEPRGAGIAGATCFPDGCQSGVCLDVHRCTQPCMDTLDCEAGTVCDRVVLQAVPGQPVVHACVPPTDGCFRPHDCKLRDGLVCSIRMMLGREHPVFRCRGNTAGAAGEPCEAHQDCSSGICTPDGLCGQHCDTDDDCRCAFDDHCLSSCSQGDYCWLDWSCETMTYSTSERDYTIRTCRPD